MNALEELLRKAIDEGKFEGLAGKGKPLHLQENPHEDPEWKLAYHLLVESGFTLPWIETRREIQADLENARRDLKQAWERHQSAPGANQHPEMVEAAWLRACARFQAQSEEINMRIRSYNLDVPIPAFQFPIVHAAVEIQTLMGPKGTNPSTADYKSKS